MRDGQDDTVFLGLSCTQELPLFVYPELQVNVDDPLHVAFAGQDVHVPFCNQYPERHEKEEVPLHDAFVGQVSHNPSFNK